MKRDIRKLFSEEENITKKLPDSHRNEFLNKLEKTNPKKKKKQLHPLKIVASILITFSLGYVVFNLSKEPTKQPLLVAQVQLIEKEYEKNIKIEWENFLRLTNDKKLINNYKEKLKILSIEYTDLAIQFKDDPNNISVLEKLVSNLKIRLQTLKDIQNHIKKLTQKNKRYETIII